MAIREALNMEAIIRKIYYTRPRPYSAYDQFPDVMNGGLEWKSRVFPKTGENSEKQKLEPEMLQLLRPQIDTVPTQNR
jgi:hypothetical protein